MSRRECRQTVNIFGEPLRLKPGQCARLGDDVAKRVHEDHNLHRHECGRSPDRRRSCWAHEHVPFVKGQRVRINSRGDLYMSYEARPFIGQEVTIVRRQKGGKWRVRLDDGREMAFAERNIDSDPAGDVSGGGE